MIQIQFYHRMLGKFIVDKTTQPDSLWYFSTLFQYCGADCDQFSSHQKKKVVDPRRPMRKDPIPTSVQLFSVM